MADVNCIAAIANQEYTTEEFITLFSYKHGSGAPRVMSNASAIARRYRKINNL